MTGSAIALPLLGAAGAHAADGATWDRLAECESGGSWISAPGNGRYGGLQLTAHQWVAYGGLDYSLSADRASRSEQIAVAEKLLADQGPEAWPGCADVFGSTSDGSSDPPDSGTSGTSDTASPSPSASEGGGPSGSGSTEPSRSAPDDGAQGKGGDGSGKGDSTGSPSTEAPSAGEGPGRHRGGRADEGAGGGAGDGSIGRHASRGGGQGEGGDRGDGAYRVRPGDNLWAIAEAHGLDGGWPALYAANEKTVGDDPDLILPGQRLDLSGLS